MTLSLKIANQSFCLTFWLMMMHHNTMLGNKLFSGLEDIIETNSDILTLHWSLEHSNPMFIQDTGLWKCIIRPSLAAEDSPVQKIQSYFDHISPCCDLDLKDSKLFFPAWHSGSWCCLTIPSFATNALRFRKYHPEKHSLIFWTFAVTLTLKTAIQFFNRTLWLMTLYSQTRLGCRQTSKLEDR